MRRLKPPQATGGIWRAGISTESLYVVFGVFSNGVPVEDHSEPERTPVDDSYRIDPEKDVI